MNIRNFKNKLSKLKKVSEERLINCRVPSHKTFFKKLRKRKKNRNKIKNFKNK